MNIKKFLNKSEISFHKKQKILLRNQFLKKINSLCNELDEQYDINAGGCCYLAYCITKILLKDGFSDIKLLVFSYDNFDDIESLEDFPYSQDHYAVSVNGYIINCDNYNLEYYNKYVFKIEDASSILEHYREGDWNITYSKSNNSHIYNLLKKTNNDFLKNLH